MKINIDNSILISAFCECFNMSITELKKELDIRNKRNDRCVKRKVFYAGELDWKESASKTDYNSLKNDLYPNYTKHIKEQGLTNILDQLWLRVIKVPRTTRGLAPYTYIQDNVIKSTGKNYLDYGGSLGIEALSVSMYFDYVYISDIDINAFKFSKYLAKNIGIKNFKTINSDKIKFLNKKHFKCISSIYTMDCFMYNEAVERLTYLLKHCDDFYGMWTMENNKQRLKLGEICAKNVNKTIKRVMPLPRLNSVTHIY